MTSAAARIDRISDDHGLLPAFRDFIAANRVLVLAVAGACLLSYGFALTNYSLSIDDEIALNTDQVGAWLPQGRFSITLLKLLLGDRMPLPFATMGIALAVLIAATLLWAFAFDRSASGRLTGTSGLILFGVFFVSVPTQAYYLTFGTFNVEVSAGYVLAGLSVLLSWRWSIERRSWVNALLAWVCALFAVGTYQPFAVVCVTGVAVALLLRMTAQPGGTRIPQRRLLREGVRCVLPTLAGAASALAVNAVLIPRDSYVGLYVGWGQSSARSIVESLAAYVRATLTGNGFVGGHAVLWAELAGLAVAAYFIWNAVRDREALLPVMFLFVLLSPFAVSVALGTPMPVRTQQVLPLAFGSFWLFVPLAFGASSMIRWGGAAAAVLIVVWNAQANTQLFMSQYLTYQYDRDRATAIVGQLVDEGWAGDPLPIVIVGAIVPPNEPFLVRSETFGGSFFSWNGEPRAAPFMRTLGYPFLGPSPEQSSRAEEAASSMPVWPALGSVELVDGIAVVKMGEPTAP